MTRLRPLRAQQVIQAFEKAGFQTARQRGSHVRMKHPDGRVITIPVHSGQDIGRGLLRKILHDAELTWEEFLELL